MADTKHQVDQADLKAIADSLLELSQQTCRLKPRDLRIAILLLEERVRKAARTMMRVPAS